MLSPRNANGLNERIKEDTQAIAALKHDMENHSLSAHTNGAILQEIRGLETNIKRIKNLLADNGYTTDN